jgi:hypothetical protein
MQNLSQKINFSNPVLYSKEIMKLMQLFWQQSTQLLNNQIQILMAQ